MVKISEQGNPSNYYIVPPLKKIKKKGLWISFGLNIRREAQYKDGELLDAKNEPYKKWGVKRRKDGTVEIKDSYLDAVVKALDKIVKAEQEAGTNVIKTLQESKFKFTIIKRANKFTANQINEKPNLQGNNACYNQIKLQNGKLIIDGFPLDAVGSGGMICWVAKGEEIVTQYGIINETPEICLAHEMFHGYDANFGDLDRTRIGKGYAITEVCEARAVYFANQLRMTKTFCKDYLRLRYHPSDVEYNLLTENGEPIYYSAPSEILKTKS